MPINIFISHAWDHSGHYDTLAGWIFTTLWNNQAGQRLYFDDTSIPKSDPVHVRGWAAIAQALANRIATSHVMVAPAGVYASHSDWIKFELHAARKYGIPIIQVNPRGQERLSLIVKQAADHEVNWNAKSVVTAILNTARRRNKREIRVLPSVLLKVDLNQFVGYK
jgi:MTH538 TIR-like domain (DUF1863)